MKTHHTAIFASTLALAVACSLSVPSAMAETYSMRVAAAGLKAPPTGGVWTVSGSPSVSAFAATNVGATSAVSATVPVKNSGGVASLGALTFTGANAADFAATNDCNAVAANGSCAVTVKFQPKGAGARAAILTVGTSVVNFSGTGKALAANCRIDANGQAWCFDVNYNQAQQSGAAICGYPVGYAGTYYSATAAAAAVWNAPLTAGTDCATNWGIADYQVTASANPSCWSNQARWARSGLQFVRCTNME